MKKFSLVIGRFQPPHLGHFKIIQTLLDEGKNVTIGLRDADLGENNPYGYEEREAKFKERFADEIEDDRIRFACLDDITEVVYGRNVGYNIREIKLPPEIEAISATQIRKQL